MNKKKKIVLILIIMLLVISIGAYMGLKLLQKDEAQNYNIQKAHSNKDLTAEDYYEYIDGKIIPSKSFNLNTLYKGDVETSDFYKSVYVLVNNLPEIVDAINGKTENELVN